MSCINCGNEIHALRCDRASILQELEEVKAERDAFKARITKATELLEHAERVDAPLIDTILQAWRMLEGEA